MKALTPAAGAGHGRLIFAMDATMSRAPTWDMALALQADMFVAVKEVGGLDVQLVYFRGHGECRASRWVSDPDALARLMTSVACHGGLTQIGKVLGHAVDEAKERKVNALVYVGDCMEENVDRLCARAGELALLGIPVFLFQEGHDEPAERAFREIARLTKGAYCRFDRGSARQLRDLLTAVAVYAAGGRKALLALSERQGAGRTPAARANDACGALRRDDLPHSGNCRPRTGADGDALVCARQHRQGGAPHGGRDGRCVAAARRRAVRARAVGGCLSPRHVRVVAACGARRPHGPAGACARRRDRPRASRRTIWRWSSITTPAACAGGS